MTPLKRNLLLLFVTALGGGAAMGYAIGGGPTTLKTVGAAMSALEVLCGLFLMSPLATARPLDVAQLAARRRVTALGLGLVLAGVGQLSPNLAVSWTLRGLSLLTMLASIVGWPRRLFPRVAH